MSKEAVQTTSAFDWKRALINVFIVFHLYIIIFWGMPGSNFRNTMVRWTENYVIKLGLWHSWDMFSPDPLSINFTVEGQITYRDGTTRVWEFPRMEKLGLWKRYQKERYRKWRERVRQDMYSVVWPDTARYIARLNNDNSNNPPVRVELIRRWGPIAPPQTVEPGKKKVRDYQPRPAEYLMPFNYKFAVYDVKAEDL
jgi:hypothetical protein